MDVSLMLFSCYVTPWTEDHQAPLSTGFPRQEYWSGVPFSSPEHLPDPEIEPSSPVLQACSLPLSHLQSPVESPGGEVKTQKPPSRIFYLVGLGWSLRIHISNKLLVNADAAYLRPQF